MFYEFICDNFHEVFVVNMSRLILTANQRDTSARGFLLYTNCLSNGSNHTVCI